MQYRRLGKTELMVSLLGYGALGLPGVTPETIQLAIEGGMNYIDTARGYTDSEVKIGKALKNMGNREKVIISSKSFSRTLQGMQMDFAKTMKNLGTDYLDLYLVHDVSTEKNWRLVQENGLIDYMKELKAQGKIRHLACSTHDEVVGRKMIESGFFEMVMLAYNAANPELEDSLIPLAKSLDMGIVIMKPLGGGILTKERSKQLGFSFTVEEALRFSASHPDVSAVIPGMDNADYVRTALRVAEEDDFTLTGEEKAALIEKVTMKGKNYCRGCRYCCPCPQGIPIPEVLKLYNRWEVYDNLDWAQLHIISKEFGEQIPPDVQPDKCIGCNICSTRCPYNLPIAELMEKAMVMKA